MTKQPESYAIILGEDIRPEVDNKFTIAGVFSAGITISRQPGEDFALATIAAFSEFYGVHGSYDVKIHVKSPDSTLLAKAEIPSAEPSGDVKNMTLAGKFQNLKFKASGTYELGVTLNDHVYKRDFEVTVVD